jgi:hypothetical protein
MPFGFGSSPPVPMRILRARANAKRLRAEADEQLQRAIDTGDDAHFERAIELEHDAVSYERGATE